MSETRKPREGSLVGSLDGLARLEHNPYGGRKTDRDGIYTFWVAATTYRVYYRINGEEVIIIHIRHTSRRQWVGERS